LFYFHHYWRYNKENGDIRKKNVFDGNFYSSLCFSHPMKWKAIFLVLLFAMCIGQEEAPEEEQVTEGPLPTEEPPIPDNLIQGMVATYFEALNNRNMDTLQSLTHPFYGRDVPSLLTFVSQNNLVFVVKFVSRLMETHEYREIMSNLSDEEFAQQVGERGLSYEIQLTVTKGDKTYEEFIVFVYVGETADGWKVLDPSLLQILIETELEIMELED